MFARNLTKTGAIALTLFAPLTSASAEELRFYNWGEYIAPDVIENFEAETGIDVIYDTYDSVEGLETKVLAGGSGFDVVVASGTAAQRFIVADLLKPLNPEALPNLTHLNPKVLERMRGFDPENAFIVPYLWGTIGLGYNVEKLEAALPGVDPSDLATLFDPANAEKLAACGIAVLDSPNEVLGIVLNYLGEDPFTTDKDAIAKAEAVMTAIRPHVRYFDNLKAIDDLATGEVCLSLNYSGAVGIAAFAAEEAGNGVEVVYAMPKQGSVVWVDSFAILADAENVEAAQKFIDYMMRPEVSAAATNYLFDANANLAATEFVDPAVTSNPNTYPPEEMFERLYPEMPIGNKAQRLRTRSWTRIKTGQ